MRKCMHKRKQRGHKSLRRTLRLRAERKAAITKRNRARALYNRVLQAQLRGSDDPEGD